MSYITTEADFKLYMFRQLGSEKHRVDISNNEYNDIYNTNIKYIRDYSSGVVYDDYILIEDIGTNKSLILADNILAVKFIKEKGSSLGLSGDISYMGGSPIYDFMMSGSGDLGSVYSFKEDIREIRKALSKNISFTFRPSSHTLDLGIPLDGGSLYLGVLVAEDLATLFDDTFFKKLMERDMWKQWHTNCTKYKGSTIGNGVELNVDNMKDNYETLKAEIKESQDNEEYDFLRPSRINPT